MVVRSCMILIAAAALLATQEGRAGEIRGSVVAAGPLVTTGRQPVSNAEIQARPANGHSPVQLATTASDGTYILRDLRAGTYDLRITATGFHSTELHDVQLGESAVSVPSVPLEVGLIGDCAVDVRPAYYRVAVGTSGSAAIGGMIVSGKATPVAGAVVTLYRKGKGGIGSTKTNEDGVFRFVNVAVEPEEFWVSIEDGGFFREEVRRLVLCAGLETVYSPITLEPCSPGHCQPYLKTIRVIPGCA